jgi:V/A-type H+/Na+-transporting ATPase subunit D
VAVAELSATRTELLARRAQVDLATRGRDLLKDKRAALMKEFGYLGASVVDVIEELGRGAVEARRALVDAVSADGVETVASAALAASGDVTTRLSSRNVAGVGVVDLEHEPVARPRTGRGYDLVATTPHVDAAAAGFERQLDRLLDVAATELSLRRLATEITRTTRRVNALEHVVIPRLERERDAIQAVLDERELEDRVRLRRARAAGRRRASATRAAG